MKPFTFHRKLESLVAACALRRGAAQKSAKASRGESGGAMPAATIANRNSTRAAPRTLMSASLMCALCCAMAGCSLSSLPRDQHGATERIRAKRVLVVGTSSVESSAAAEKTMSKSQREEQRLVQAIAARLGARVQWRRGNVHALLEDLEELKLPLVAAALPCDSPFSESVGFSKPYLEDGPDHKDYCLAVAPGENRLLLLIDQEIALEKKRREKQSEAKGGGE